MFICAYGCGDWVNINDPYTYDGFDQYNFTSISSPIISNVGKSIYFNYANGNSGFNVLRKPVSNLAGKTIITFGKWKTSYNNIKLNVWYDSNGNEQCSLWLNNVGKLEARLSNGTIIATGTSIVNNNSLHHISIKLKVASAGNGGLIEIKLNDNTEFSVSGVNTQSQSTNTVYYISWGPLLYGAPNTYLSHFGIFTTDTGDTCNDHPPSSFVVGTFVPTGNIQTDFLSSGGGAASYTNIDEIIGSVNTTDYNYASGIAVNRFSITPNINASYVYGIQIKAMAQKTDAASVGYTLGVEYNSIAQNTTIVNLGTGWGVVMSNFIPYNNGISSLWTQTIVNNSLYIREARTS